MRTIDADDLLREINTKAPEHRLTFGALVSQSPTIDAVPVVRCNDCKHGTYHDWSYPIRCKQHGRWFKEDDYCSEGVRRDDDG